MNRPTGMPRAAVATAVGVYACFVHPRMQHFGATETELRKSYPGDELVSGGRRGSVMATTIHAPPAAVWPWLVQMGCNRGGFYSWDRLDNGGRPSAERIHPEWQQLEEGDRIPSVPDESRWFDVALLRPERALVLRASLTLPAMQCFDPGEATPKWFIDTTWGFFLSPTPQGGTRLVVTGRACSRPGWYLAASNWLFWDPAHWVMQKKQFAGLRRRAATLAVQETDGAHRAGLTAVA